MVLSSKDVKDAASQGPVYVMLVLGASMIAAVIPLQITTKQLNSAEFITVNVIGAALILAAGILYLTVTLMSIRALKEASSNSTTTASNALDAMKQAAEKLSEQDATTQRLYMDNIINLTKAMGIGTAPVAAPAGAPAVAGSAAGV